MKAIANTTIRLGLINLPVQVVKATESANEISFKQAGPTGEQLRQAYLLPDGTECPKDDIQKGVFQGDTFHPVSKDAIEQIAEATKLPDLNVLEVIDMEDFRAAAHRSTGLYYLQNSKKLGSPNAFKLFVDALAKEGKCLVTKWTARSRQSLMVMYPQDGILMGTTLCFDGDVREADEGVKAHMDATYGDKEMDMAVQLLSALSTDKPTALVMETDEALPLKNKLIQDTLAGQIVAVTAKPEPKPTTDLADALAASLAAVKAV